VENAHALWQPAALSCYTALNSQRYTLMAEDAVESAGAKAPAITFLNYDSPRAMENMCAPTIKFQTEGPLSC
jgi:hypothetical protein